MTPNRRLHPRPYFFELFVGANLLAVYLFAARTTPLLGSFARSLAAFTLAMVAYGAVGVGIRSVIALLRGDRSYFRVIRSPAWIFDTIRIALVCGVGSLTYAWIKLIVPIYHPRLFDQQLWDLEQTLFGGISPNILFLELFSNPTALRAVDHSYAWVFLLGLFVATAFFVSHASRRVRVAYATSNMLMWIAGAWLYMLLPSLGPAYRFPEVWFAYSEHLGRTQWMQALLMRNYQNVLRVWQGGPAGSISILYGIGAFPSLHVAFQTLVFVWMRKIWRSGELLFGILVVVIFAGSVVTGWHYLLDGVAGALLAVGAYQVAARMYGVGRWLRLRK